METGRVTVEDLALETDFQKSPGKSSVSILGFDVDNLNWIKRVGGEHRQIQ